MPRSPLVVLITLWLASGGAGSAGASLIVGDRPTLQAPRSATAASALNRTRIIPIPQRLPAVMRSLEDPAEVNGSALMGSRLVVGTTIPATVLDAQVMPIAPHRDVDRPGAPIDDQQLRMEILNRLRPLLRRDDLPAEIDLAMLQRAANPGWLR